MQLMLVLLVAHIISYYYILRVIRWQWLSVIFVLFRFFAFAALTPLEGYSRVYIVVSPNVS